jgi:hypothetical protein
MQFAEQRAIEGGSAGRWPVLCTQGIWLCMVAAAGASALRSIRSSCHACRFPGLASFNPGSFAACSLQHGCDCQEA